MSSESACEDVESRRGEESVDADLAALLAVGVGAWSVALTWRRVEKAIEARRRRD